MILNPRKNGPYNCKYVFYKLLFNDYNIYDNIARNIEYQRTQWSKPIKDGHKTFRIIKHTLYRNNLINQFDLNQKMINSCLKKYDENSFYYLMCCLEIALDYAKTYKEWGKI